MGTGTIDCWFDFILSFRGVCKRAVAVLWGSNKSMESKNRSWEAARAVVAWPAAAEKSQSGNLAGTLKTLKG